MNEHFKKPFPSNGLGNKNLVKPILGVQQMDKANFRPNHQTSTPPGQVLITGPIISSSGLTPISVVVHLNDSRSTLERNLGISPTNSFHEPQMVASSSSQLAMVEVPSLPNPILNERKIGKSAESPSSGNVSQPSNTNINTNPSSCTQEILPMAQMVDVITSLDPNRHSTVTFKEPSSILLNEHPKMKDMDGSIVPKSKATSLVTSMKYGGIKINSTINKNKSSKGNKSKFAKNKIMVRDFVTKLARNLANSAESLGVHLIDLNTGHDEMQEQSSQ